MKPTNNPKHTDANTTLKQLKDVVEKAFIHERQWTPYHTPKNLSMNIAIEAAELMELFLWMSAQESYDILKDAQKRKEIEYELADVLIAILSFANRCSIDLSSAFAEKFGLIKQKYPIKKAKGKSDKYTAYQ